MVLYFSPWALFQVHDASPSITVFCSYSADAHQTVRNQGLGSNAYLEFEQVLRTGLQPNAFPRSGLDSLAVEASPDKERKVRYFPLYCIHNEVVFSLPTCGADEHSWSKEDSPLGYGCGPVQEHQPSQNYNRKQSISRVCHSLLGFAAHAGIKFETYSLGPVSGEIGEAQNLIRFTLNNRYYQQHLAVLSSLILFSVRSAQEIGKSGNPMAVDGSVPEIPAALILVDRAMDMIAPVMHEDNLVERVFSAADMKENIHSEGDKQPGRSLI